MKSEVVQGLSSGVEVHISERFGVHILSSVRVFRERLYSVSRVWTRVNLQL
jgi:hypothetical protein